MESPPDSLDGEDRGERSALGDKARAMPQPLATLMENQVKIRITKVEFRIVDFARTSDLVLRKVERWGAGSAAIQEGDSSHSGGI